jgi:hypothetical protein
MLVCGVLLLFVAVFLALFGFEAMGDQGGDLGKVSAGTFLAVAVLCLAAGWVFWRRSVVRDETARRWTAWTR